MGFKRKPKEYNLKFQENDYDGFECLMGSLSVDQFIEITGLASKLQANMQEEEDVRRLFDLLASKIIRWNLEDDDGNPVEHTPEQLRKEDFDFIMAIQLGWMGAMASVQSPLQNGLNNGETAQEDITKSLESLSQNLPS